LQILHERDQLGHKAKESNSCGQGFAKGLLPGVIYILMGMVLALLGYFILTSGASQAKGPFGDIDGNGVVNAVDVQLVINGALGIPVPYNTDITGSGTTNAVDVQLVINAALGIFPDLGNDEIGRLEFHVIALPASRSSSTIWNVVLDLKTGGIVTWRTGDFSSVRAISFQQTSNS